MQAARNTAPRWHKFYPIVAFMPMFLFQKLDLNFYFKMAILAVILCLGFVVIRHQFIHTDNKKGMNIRLGIAAFFIALSIGYGLYSYYQV